MEKQKTADTHQKALELNLDTTRFGSFAEIGAGQEVARWFLRVGAASGTVAKTICAYDKEVSDDLYGAGSRYVSRQRLEAMLDREWQQLLLQLGESRGAESRFFAFADTISSRNFAGTNEPHGWLGIRFQLQPGDEPNDILIHVYLLDPSSSLQQEAVGILGVNLVYAASRQMDSTDSFLDGLSQEMKGRIEIDFMDWRGPAFEQWDRKFVLIDLVTKGLTEVVAFLPDGRMLPPTEVLHNKKVVLSPGIFDVVEPFQRQMLASAIQAVQSETGSSPTGLFCLAYGPENLRRLETLLKEGYSVLLTRMEELYKMAAYVKRYTASSICFAIGLPLLIRVLEDAYGELEGHTLEGISRLFTQNVRVYVYPMTLSSAGERVQSMRKLGWEIEDADGWITANGIRPRPPINHLYNYILSSGFVIPMQPRK